MEKHEVEKKEKGPQSISSGRMLQDKEIQSTVN